MCTVSRREGRGLNEMALISRAYLRIFIFLLPAHKKIRSKVLCGLCFPWSVISSTVIVCLQEEIQQLKAKLEKVEKERNELRLNTDRLESKVKKIATHHLGISLTDIMTKLYIVVFLCTIVNSSYGPSLTYPNLAVLLISPRLMERIG